MRRRSRRRVAVVLGTRPEIIKLSPILRELQRRKSEFSLIHTGQHYSYEMDKLFFRQLGLPVPDHHLSLPSKTMGRQGAHTGVMMGSLERVFLHEKPDVVLVQGDTNTVLAASLVVAKLPDVALGHVEAGLRSFDRSMPEETNRIVSDHVSDYLFAPTPESRRLLLSEGIEKRKIFLTGNTIVDAVRQNLGIARNTGDAVKKRGLHRKRYFLLTLHRQENVDHPDRLSAILKGLSDLHETCKLPIYFPMHPRTRRRLEEFGIKLPRGVVEARPAGFLDFLQLEVDARLILSDSGGVQEEACILGVPCVTLRTTTERPETVDVGANLVAGYDPEHIMRCAHRMMNKRRAWRNPFGDGRAAEAILNILERKTA